MRSAAVRLCLGLVLAGAGCGSEMREAKADAFVEDALDLDGAGDVGGMEQDTAAAAEDTSGPPAGDAPGEDAVAADAGPRDAGEVDDGAAASDGIGPDAEPVDCEATAPFDYRCTSSDPDSCPGGMCVFGLCVAPVLGEGRWDECGDGVCEPCESAEGCPADCAPDLALPAPAVHDPDTTLTIWLHGFSNKSAGALEEMTYGELRGCSGTLAAIMAFAPERPCGATDDGATAPNHWAAVGYYGALPPDWMTPEDVAEVEQLPYVDGPLGLQRYGLVAAKFIRWRMALSGATHVNLACHSMGCLVARYLIENDVEGLASERRVARWVSSAGVIAGARLARLYDNPTIQSAASLIGLEVSDFILMHPDYVQDVAAWWDHKLHEGNNPRLGGVLIHHATATDPRLGQALDLQLLDLNNPEDLPNDGIMYTDDQYFHRQDEAASFHTATGEVLRASRSQVHVDHLSMTSTRAFQAVAAAHLFHHRRVVVTVEELELHDDRERDHLLDFSERGDPPAEIIVEAEIRYEPFLSETFGHLADPDLLIHEDKLAHRTPAMWVQEEGTVASPGHVVFEGPVFDGMDAITVRLEAREVDWYPKLGVLEWALKPSERLVTLAGELPLPEPGVLVLHTVESQYARMVVSISVVGY